MKYFSLFIVLLVFTGCKKELNYKEIPKGINIELADGTLGIYPVTDNAVRIKLFKEEEPEIPEFIFTNNPETPEFKTTETSSKLAVTLKNLQVVVDKKTGRLSYASPTGKIFLQEKAGSRRLVPDSVEGEPCFIAEQGFESPEDESVFGLGQFQDGHYNLKGVTRRLTQVNSQISIPFIYSSKGYGLLWHQYGLTDYNPADNLIELKKQEQPAGDEELIEVTTTAGTQKVSQNQTLYTGQFSVPEDGEYSVFLDLGDMGNRYYVVIDGKPYIDQTNMWLPPTVGTIANLEKGEHNVQVICKSDNKPKLSWKLNDNSTIFRSPNAKELDYVVFYGPSADKVISSYRNLSGNAPMFPKWAYGFWQCRERYTSGKQLVETVEEFRNRELPMDVIVQDWQYWGSKGWGVPQLDEENYPNPSGFISEIHDMNARFCISIWSNPDKNSELGREYVNRNRFIPGTKWLDYFNPKTRQEYWNTLNENLFVHGVDAWWMDAVEPENDALEGTQTHIGPGNFYRLTYPLMVSKAVYEGQRNTTSDKRVCILTRSAFSGQQKYGMINWSGDIGGTWDGYRRQILAGLNFTITGLPYWTSDIGGFFRPGPSQYTDERYHELLTRWFQWGTFNPIFRVHGYQSETEPWKYGPTVEANMRKMLNLRYRLIPYIYSEAWNITQNGSTMMRPLVMDFREDTEAVNHLYQYMFGNSFLVAPVTQPDVLEREVYLPETTSWYDFWTGKHFNGGQTINANAPMDQIPLFVKAGSIVPMDKISQHTGESNADSLEIRIYQGADGSFSLYEDEGDNYNYENGKFSVVPFEYNEQNQTLVIGDREGQYPGYLKTRVFNIVLVNEDSGMGIAREEKKKTVTYSGSKIEIKL
ncbi:TIM-barrel domain-containing protein [Thermophagus sp. OGC60D27]|uniref:TIM-barrel domain-containing protein n=1 Tax=Thermophagus sp. OGC60D27 TaxID=3458415 RepID=UPI004037D86F